MFKEMLESARSFLRGPSEAMPDPTPVEAVLRPRPSVNSLQSLRDLQFALDYQARMQGRETFEEANDFDVDDGYDEPPLTPAQQRYLSNLEALNAPLVDTSKPPASAPAPAAAPSKDGA